MAGYHGVTSKGPGRRSLLRAASALPAVAAGPATARRLPILHSARPGARFEADEFAIVGVFDVDWLAEPRYLRLFDTLAASPGAVRGVRVFGVLNSGVREDEFPTLSGGVWRRAEEPMDFSATLAALEALTARALVPFLPLTFFPPAVSASPIAPPPDLAPWQALVRGFLDAAVARFGAEAVGRWWFEVWNEPNMPPFWGGSFDRYLELYRATSEAVAASGHAVRLGGPVLAWMPDEGPALMRRFLEFLRREPALRCDFLSMHRKGAWTNEEGEPRLRRSVQAAEETAAMALELVPERCRGLAIVNDEADMMVGFQRPYAPRLDERFPAWLAAQMVAYDALSERHAATGIRFLAASDNANQHLVRAPFDGRRALMTRTDAAPDDLLKLPVFGFYELLRLLGSRHGAVLTPPSPALTRAGLHQLVTVGPDGIAALLVRWPDEPGDGPLEIDYGLRDIPWPRVNLAEFRIDSIHGNVFAAAGRRMPAAVGPALARRIRAAQELGVAAPIRRGLRVTAGRLGLTLRLDPYATALVWITPASAAVPAAPAAVEARVERGDVHLSWTPSREPAFYTYEVLRLAADRPEARLSPLPLRGAAWVDTAPPRGRHLYGVRTVSASGVRSALVRSRAVNV